jgi:acetylornithine deacetylase
MDPAIRLLRDLVAIDSVNPSLVPGAAGEGAIADFIAGELRAIGLAVTRQEALPGRPNVVGILEGRAPGRALMLCGHMDTVTVEGMERPFDPVIRDGRLYGRGAQDMKGGVAAMIDAARVLAGPGLPKGRLVIACVIDEEYESAGVEALVREWPALSGAEGPADAAVVTEPTDLAIAIGHRGFAWVEIETKGRAAHGSRPRDGRDAIARMGHVLVRLERLDHELQARPPHPVMGTGSLHASIVQGGRELSSYPDRCVLQIERRTIAGEPPQTPLAEVERILSELSAEDPEFEASARLMFSRPPYEIAATHELPQALRAAAPHNPNLTGMSFWTDAAVLGGAGIASVLFGPGGAGLHSREEYVRIEEVITCRDTLARLAQSWCERGRA